MIHARLFAALAVTAVAGIAAADSLTLHSQDSITIDGQRYTCDDPSRRGVQLSPGDHVTAGKYELRCKGGNGGGGNDAPATPAAPTALTVVSEVDWTCFIDLTSKIDDHPSPAEGLRWPDACRPFEISSACSVTTTEPDDQCFRSANNSISGSLSSADVPRLQRACSKVTATCPFQPTAIRSHVDLDCLAKTYQAVSGKPTGRAVIGWLEACREHAAPACIAVAGRRDADCVNKAFQMISGKFTPAEAAGAERACRVVDLRCP